MTFVKEAALACLADLNGFTKIKAISNKTDRPPVIGIDIGKTIFHLIGLDRRGAIVFKTKLSRSQLENRLANMPPCLVGMEACVGAHHLSRQLIALGHNARLMPAKYVKAFLKGNKNDFQGRRGSPRMVRIIEALASDWRRFDERIDEVSAEIETLARKDIGCER